jgi:transcriptional regulator with XRE-family HTH domain
MTQGLSQRAMAERLGVDPGTLQGWESRQHQPSQRMLERIEELRLQRMT